MTEISCSVWRERERESKEEREGRREMVALQLNATEVEGVVYRNVGMKWNSLVERGKVDRDLYSCVRVRARVGM